MAYDLRALARAQGHRGRIAPIADRLSAVRAYRTALRAILRGLRAELRERILSEMQAERRITTDEPGDWHLRLARKARELAGIATGTVETILAAERGRHDAEWPRRVKSALGVDVAAALRREGIDRAMAARLAANVALIQGLADDTAKALALIVSEAAVADTAVTTVRKRLTDRLGIADRRAGLIARDQMASWSGDLNRIRQQEAGIAEYEWSTSADERVRPLHRALNGRRFRWDRPGPAEGGAHPGGAVQCRCVALAVVEW